MRRNVETRFARSTRRPEHAAQSQLFDSSAAAVGIREKNFLRSRSERNYLLDDTDGDGPVHARRVLDDRPQRECSGLQTFENGAVEIARHGDEPPATEQDSLENVLSAGGHEIVSAKAA